jgi:hypothetical protein
MAAYVSIMCDQTEAPEGEGYTLSGDSFDPDNSPMSIERQHCAQQELDDYAKDLPANPSSGDDTDNGFGNGMENLLSD